MNLSWVNTQSPGNRVGESRLVDSPPLHIHNSSHTGTSVQRSFINSIPLAIGRDPEVCYLEMTDGHTLYGLSVMHGLDSVAPWLEEVSCKTVHIAKTSRTCYVG